MTVRNFCLSLMAALALGACGGGEVETPAPVQDSSDMPAEENERPESPPPPENDDEERRRGDAVANARATLEQQVYFDYDVSEIRSDQRTLMRRKAEILNASPQVQIRIEGHADERGSTEYNLALGSRRATAIRDYLVGFGLAEARFATVSYGEEQPADRGSNEGAWQMNRRVEFRITAGAGSINPPGG